MTPSALSLTPADRRVLELIKDGASNKAIARELGLAEITVKVRVHAILRKIGARNRTQAAIWALGHLSPDGSGNRLSVPAAALIRSTITDIRAQLDRLEFALLGVSAESVITDKAA